MPSGFLGRTIAAVMEKETAAVNREAIALLDPRPGERVLDVGMGPGMSLRHLAARVDEGIVVGVDHSPVMCGRAARNNKALIAKGQVRVENARSDDLPFEADSFDAAMSVHTLYFWAPADPHLEEIARVLCPGGRLVLAFRPDSDPATADFPESVYTFRSIDEIRGLVEACGFENGSVRNGSDAVTLLSATRRKH